MRLIPLFLGMLAALLSIEDQGIPAQEPHRPKLLLAFSSYRERPMHPNIYFYEHDGVSNGRIIGSIVGPRSASAYAHPSLTHDGRFCAFSFEVENQTGRIHLWDLQEKKVIEPPGLNDSPNAQMSPSLSGDGKLVAFSAWNRPRAPSQRWHVFLYDVPGTKLLDLPNLNSRDFDERMPALSGDGHFLAFTFNARSGVGLTDVYLYDRQTGKVLTLPEMNSRSMDVEPSLNGDGRLIALASDRPGGVGGRDIYLYDRAEKKFLPLPGLNSVSNEYTPSLSRDGRYLAFVSERLGGEGERDVYLYDREAQKLLPTPGLNSRTEDFDPCVIVLK